MDRPSICSRDSGLSRSSVRRLCTRLCGYGGSLAEISGARLRTGSGTAGSLVLSHFPDRIFFAHRIHGIALPCLPAGFAPLGAE